MTLQTSNGVFFTVLPARPLERLGWEVRIYDADNPNTLLAVLGEWRGLAFTDELSGVGNGRISIRLDSPALLEPLPTGVFSYGLLEEPNIFRVFWNGVPRFSFVHDQDTEPEVTADEEGGLWITLAGPGVADMIARAAVMPKNWAGFPAPYDPADKVHKYVAVAYADIFRQHFWYAQTRGALNDMSLGFENAVDSHEEPWVFNSDVSLPPGGNLLDLLTRWGEVSFDWHVDPFLKISVWQNLGLHLEESVRFWAGGDIRSTEKSSDRREIKNYIVVEASDGSTAVAADADSQDRWKRREAYLSVGEADDVSTAQRHADAALRSTKDEAIERSLKVNPDTPGRTVFDDYGLGDWISLVAGPKSHPEEWTEPEAHRVLAITIAVDDATADAECELLLQNKFQAAAVRMARKLKQLAILREGRAGDVATPVATATQAELGNVNDQITDLGVSLQITNGSVEALDVRLTAAEYMETNAQAGAYTAVLSDAGKAVEITAATDVAFTIPPDLAVPFPNGTVIEIVQMGVGAVVLTAGSGVTLQSAGLRYKTGGQYAVGSIRKRSTNLWIASGDLAL